MTTRVGRQHPQEGLAHPQSPALHTPAEAAELLAVKESWLRRKAGARLIPCTFLGKHLRFSDDDLQAIIRSGAQPMRASNGRRQRSR